MSSDESDSAQKDGKRKRLQRACDACKKKRVKCDSAKMPDEFCTNCIVLGILCTHQLPVKKRGPKTHYVAQLEKRIVELEQTVRELQTKLKESKTLAQCPFLARPDDRDATAKSDAESAALTQRVHHLRITQVDASYYGACANVHFAKMALQMQGLPPWNPNNASEWDLRPWEASSMRRHRWQLFSFPDEDLLVTLMDLFFANTNRYMTLLHESIFRRDVASGLHMHDRRFGEILLLVCALGAGFSDDRRVFIDGVSAQSAGWFWFEQATSTTKSPFEATNLYDVQRSCLVAKYIMGTTATVGCWLEISHALRMAVSMGYHRYRTGTRTVESELRNRAFWCAYLLDRHTSFYYGRPPSLRDEDFDLSLPVECEDEYWESNPFSATLPFTQPTDKPARCQYFHLHIKLGHIMTIVIRTIYLVRKSKQAATPEGWSLRINSMLDSWFDSIPPYLQWRPDMPDWFLDQSAILHVVYYHIRIQLHRPFIGKSASAMDACVEAARSCVQILEIRSARAPILTYELWAAAFAAGIVFRLNLVMKKDLSVGVDVNDGDAQDLHRCLQLLRSSNERHITINGYLDCLESSFAVPQLFGSNTHREDTSSWTSNTQLDASTWLEESPFGLSDMSASNGDMSFFYDPAFFNRPINWDDEGGAVFW